MADIKTVGVKDLKNNLSAHLREVKRGVVILVADRDRVIAELREPGVAYAAGGGNNPLLERWAREGKVRLPTRPRGPLERTGLKSPAGTAERLIDEGRREAWEEPS
jgi:antitoxin (DNA-binding transcriptional repressor) of toxin-antitoxin stability system